MTYLISPSGDAISTVTGYDEKLSLAIMDTVGAYAVKDRPRRLRFITEFITFELKPSESDREFLSEDCETAGAPRAKAHLEDLGLVVTSAPGFDGDFHVENPAGGNNAVSDRIATLRKFRETCNRHGCCAKANPWAITNWHEKADDEKDDFYRRRHPKAKWGFIHAGGRFRTVNREFYPPLMEDPEACGPAMTKAIRDFGVPISILQICMTMETSGQRYSDVAYGNCLGWSGSDFGEWFWGRNKFERNPYAKPIVMSAEVRDQLVERFESMPHPTMEGRTMMDRLRELAGRRDPEARMELASIPLFPSSRGTPYAYSTFNGHWFRPAIEKSGLLIHSDQGSRRPTSMWYRHAVYTAEMEEIYETEEDDNIETAREELGASFGHKSDQSGRYAPLIEKRRAIEKQFEQIAKRKAKREAKRSGVALPKENRLADAEAERMLANLPRRRVAA